MARAFVSVGSNVQPAANVRTALTLLAARVHIVAVSTVYLTAPLGRPEQDSYYNCVVEIETGLPPRDVKEAVLRRVEDALGRRRSADKYAPRTIDLDLIAYGDLVVNETGMHLPDPEISERPFLALPLCELAPGWRVTGSDRPIEAVAAQLDCSDMRPLPDYTRRLRQEVMP